MKCSSIVMLFYPTSPTSHKGIVLLYKAVQKKCHFNRGYSSISTFSETDYFAYWPILFRSIHF